MSTEKDVDQNATFFYGRAHMARTRSMCGLGNCNGYATFFYEIYGNASLPNYNAALVPDLTKPSIDSVNWYKNTLHDPATDGNVTGAAPSTDVTTNFAVDGSTTKATFVYNPANNGFPYKVSIDVFAPAQTQRWLIYDKYNNLATKVTGPLEFYGPGKWSSTHGADTSVQDDNTSNIKNNTNRRIRW